MKRRIYCLMMMLAAVGFGTACKGVIANRSGVSHYREGEVRQAMEEFDSALDVKVNYRFARNNRGLVNYLEGNYSAALHDFNVALSRRPNYPEARNNRGVLFLDRGEDERALVDIDHAIKRRDEYQEAHFNRARLHLTTMQLDDALESIDRAIALRTDDGDNDKEWPEAYYLRGMILQQLGESEAAEADFQKSLEQAPEMGEQFEEPYLQPLKAGLLSG